MRKAKNKLDAKNFTINELLDIEGCTRCGNCTPLCCVYEASGDIDISPAKKLAVLKKRYDYKYSLPGKLTGSREIPENELAALEKAAFFCTLCARCEVECPVNLGLKDLWISLRASLVTEGRYPKELDRLRETLKNGKNKISVENKNQAVNEWLEKLADIPGKDLVKKTADIVYFTGCVCQNSAEAIKIPQSMIKLFQRSREDFSLMGSKEWCCGFPLLAAGFKEDAMRFAEHNINSVNEMSPRYLIASCPTCYYMWKYVYPEMAQGIMNRYTYPVPVLARKMNFEVMHAVQYLSKLVREKKFDLKPLNKKITYHDPCYLGRNSGIYEEPREIINAIPGIEFIELENSREYAKCCGGGGNLEIVNTELSEKVAQIRAKEIIKTGAEILVSACPQCESMLSRALEKEKSQIKVMDITQLLLASIEDSD